MMTTILSDTQLNVPTRDDDLNELLKEVREATDEDWQVVEYVNKSRSWLRDKEHVWYGLHVYVGGLLPYQVLICVNTAKECRAYLHGLLSGLSDKYKENEL